MIKTKIESTFDLGGKVVPFKDDVDSGERELTSVSSILGIVLYQWLFSPAMFEDLGKTEGSDPVRLCSTRKEAFI